MRNLALAATASLALAACGSETSGTIEGEDGETAEYTIDRSSGEMNATITTDEGTATVRSGTDIPVDLPDGFSLYPGATVVNNTTFAQGDAGGSMIMFQSEDSPEEVATFYRKQAEDAGIDIEFEMNANGGRMFGGKDEDGRTVTVNASESDGMTTAQLTVGREAR